MNVSIIAFAAEFLCCAVVACLPAVYLAEISERNVVKCNVFLFFRFI